MSKKSFRVMTATSPEEWMISCDRAKEKGMGEGYDPLIHRSRILKRIPGKILKVLTNNLSYAYVLMGTARRRGEDHTEEIYRNERIFEESILLEVFSFLGVCSRTHSTPVSLDELDQIYWVNRVEER